MFFWNLKKRKIRILEHCNVPYKGMATIKPSTEPVNGSSQEQRLLDLVLASNKKSYYTVFQKKVHPYDFYDNNVKW